MPTSPKSHIENSSHFTIFKTGQRGALLFPATFFAQPGRSQDEGSARVKNCDSKKVVVCFPKNWAFEAAVGAVKPKPDLRLFLDGHGFDPGCNLVKFDEFGDLVKWTSGRAPFVKVGSLGSCVSNPRFVHASLELQPLVSVTKGSVVVLRYHSHPTSKVKSP